MKICNTLLSLLITLLLLNTSCKSIEFTESYNHQSIIDIDNALLSRKAIQYVDTSSMVIIEKIHFLMDSSDYSSVDSTEESVFDILSFIVTDFANPTKKCIIDNDLSKILELPDEHFTPEDYLIKISRSNLNIKYRYVYKSPVYYCNNILIYDVFTIREIHSAKGTSINGRMLFRFQLDEYKVPKLKALIQSNQQGIYDYNCNQYIDLATIEADSLYLKAVNAYKNSNLNLANELLSAALAKKQNKDILL